MWFGGVKRKITPMRPIQKWQSYLQNHISYLCLAFAVVRISPEVIS